MKAVISCLLLSLAAVAHALSATGDRLLSIWEDVEDKKLYSKFIQDLEGRGFKITHATPKQDDLKLQHLGEKVYDHIIFFPIKAKGLGPKLTAKLLLDFLEAGGNILVALSSSNVVPTSINSLLIELDIHVPPERTGLVVDHFNYDVSSAADQHDVILLQSPGLYKPGTRDFFGSGSNTDLIAFPHGIGQVLGDGPQLIPILKAPRTAYIYDPNEQALAVDEVFAVGEQLNLISAHQGRNSARFTLVGAAELFQDKWFDAQVKRPGDNKAVKAWNQEFSRRISGWTFHEIGHLRVNEVEHHLAEGGRDANVSNPGIYRINQNVTYTISISEWAWNHWSDFTAPESDEVQLEFSMLSPFHRIELTKQDGASARQSSVFRATFTIPDQHGVFNFMTNYKRPFLSNVEEKRSVTVRHMAHDEYPFSYEIPAAWPYVMSIGVTCTGWLIFIVLWMFNKPTHHANTTKKTQ